MKLFDTPISLPSDRKFGFFFTFVFAVVAIAAAAIYGKFLPGIVAAVISSVFLFTTLTRPSLLRGLNKSWAYIGLLMGLIISPVVLGLIYFGMFTPLAVVLRLKGRDELRLKNRNLKSNWIVRDPLGPSPESFKDQY